MNLKDFLLYFSASDVTVVKCNRIRTNEIVQTDHVLSLHYLNVQNSSAYTYKTNKKTVGALLYCG